MARECKRITVEVSWMCIEIHTGRWWGFVVLGRWHVRHEGKHITVEMSWMCIKTYPGILWGLVWLG
ncbi:hypothetical protein BCR33DRAFT_730084 [Rhizoclosmatium globosum]|uniref:Uncharacterized protein n=1 Tax=Rhizoclosmatium globosum TaxID=329046 RepID=A0A1Y2AD97_9FUNG|nr:hypothetical protein BCR33DRAFT_730084 [Rhizoclosmatium globosum]|eukprot:ORY20539.1 hypothetical protein BCR33DRAFT_730084 [Rhizoclosmatium globosum]